MKPAVLLFTLALCAGAQTAIRPVASVAPAQMKPIERQSLLKLEQQFDDKVSALGGLDHCLLLGNTRAIHLPGFGVVFTAELDLIQTPGLTPMRPRFSPDELAKIHKRKTDRLPLLYQAMKDTMVAIAAALPTMPAEEKIVLAVRLDYRPYEDTANLPGQVLMTANRAGAAAGDIRVELQ